MRKREQRPLSNCEKRWNRRRYTVRPLTRTVIPSAGQRTISAGEVDTGLLQTVVYQPNELEIIRSGLEMTVQAFPGRQGYWDVGVPPSGPMDDLSFQLGNRMLGNPVNAAGLEMVLAGAKIKFRNSTLCVLTGAQVAASLNGQAVESSKPFAVAPGQILSIDDMEDGLRSYLLLRGGLDVAEFLGSSATFVLGQFGGHQGRALRAGDVLRWIDADGVNFTEPLKQDLQVDLAKRYTLNVLLGPHAAPDFFTPDGIDQLFEASWQVDHNSNRTGIRLNGPAPNWAREDGGEAGLHPSNIHDSPMSLGRWTLPVTCPLSWVRTVPLWWFCLSGSRDQRRSLEAGSVGSRRHRAIAACGSTPGATNER